MLFRRKMFKKKNNKKLIKIKVVLLIVFLFISFLLIDDSISDIVAPSIVNNCQSVISNVINMEVDKVLNEREVSYDELVVLEYNEGEISSLSLDSVYINKLKSNLVYDIENELYKNNVLVTDVEIGNVLNLGIFSNRGPKIPIKYNYHSTVNSNITSEFESAGVNQTRHFIKLNIVVDVYVCNFSTREYFEMRTDYILGDTVIVGKTPSVYGGSYSVNTLKDG